MQNGNQEKAKILVVDDELLVAADIKRILEKAGHKIIGAAINAEEAIEFVKLEKPGLVLMDVKLKHDTDGISAAEKIQAIADIPIIFLTAFSDHDTFERAKKLGPFGYLIKPFNSRELIIAVENSLYKYSLDKRLRENEKRFRLFYENSPLPYHSLDMAGNILEINDAWLDELGYSKDEVIGHHLNEFLTPSSLAKLPAAFHEYIMTGELKRMEFEYKHKDGSVILMSVSGKANNEENGEILKTHSVLHNITEQKHAEELLKEAKEKFESIYKLSPYAITITDLVNSAVIDVNEAFEELTGYIKDEVIGKKATELNIWSDFSKSDTFTSGLLEEKPYSNKEILIRKKTGERVECLASAKIIELSGKPHILSVIKDISDRKRSEYALRESENKMQSIFRAAPIGIGVILNRIIMQVNEEYCRMTGYDMDELFGKDCRIIYPSEEEYEYVGTEKYKQIAEKGFGRVETKWRKKDGSIIDVFLSSTPIDPKKPERGVVFTAVDITERKRMEDALRKSEAKTRELLDNLVSGVMIVDTDGNWNYLNKKAAENFGGEPKDYLGKNIFDYLPRNVEDLSFIKKDETTDSDDNLEYEAAFNMPVGGEKYFLISDQVLKDDDGNPYGVLSNSIDISSRKRLEMAMNNIIVLNHELDELTIDDILKRCLESCENATYSKISFFHFLDPDQKTVTNRTWSPNTMKTCSVSNLDAHYPINEAGVWIDCVNKREPVVHNDYNSLPHKKGLPPGHVNLVRQLTIPIFEEDKIVAIIGVGNKESDYEELDIKLVELISNNVWKIIRRKKTEEDLKNSLLEKETLLRELYHRTKNNMQVISSMLLLQTFGSDDSHLNSVLIETSNRIKAMALVHEKLYQSKNLSRISLGDYINDLIKLLISIYSVQSKKIHIKQDLEEIYILIDYAVPYGLVINEIVSSTFKNSFPGDNDGELSVKLFRNEDGEIVFISQDNSINNTINFESANSNAFGLELIKTIVEHQLGGKIEFQNKNGIFVKISFKDDQYKSRV